MASPSSREETRVISYDLPLQRKTTKKILEQKLVEVADGKKINKTRGRKKKMTG